MDCSQYCTHSFVHDTYFKMFVVRHCLWFFLYSFRPEADDLESLLSLLKSPTEEATACKDRLSLSGVFFHLWFFHSVWRQAICWGGSGICWEPLSGCSSIPLESDSQSANGEVGGHWSEWSKEWGIAAKQCAWWVEEDRQHCNVVCTCGNSHWVGAEGQSTKCLCQKKSVYYINCGLVVYVMSIALLGIHCDSSLSIALYYRMCRSWMACKPYKFFFRCDYRAFGTHSKCVLYDNAKQLCGHAHVVNVLKGKSVQ